MDPWPHQTRTVDAVLAAIASGKRRIVVCIPTGGGKTFCMVRLALSYLGQRRRVALYTNRKNLIEQLSEDFGDAGIAHGVRAAEADDEREHPMQVCSFQTEHSRCVKRGVWKLHDAALVEVDEGHLQTGKTAQHILDQHIEAGAVVVYFTATPLDMADVADCLIVGANQTDLRECRAIVPCYHLGCDEPDCRVVRRVPIEEDPEPVMNEGELTEPQARSLMGKAGGQRIMRLHGRVWDWFCRLNPDRRPTLLFGPGVAESLWYAERFTARGCKAAHIDGDNIWIAGNKMPSTPEARQQLRDASRCGDVVVVCTRYVMREGINWPWLAHGIFATVFGSLQTYLQSGGRLLRSYPGLDHVTVQDHGGNWWRWGSLNENRQWNLESTSQSMAALRASRLRERKLPRPFRCPKCGRVWTGSRHCDPTFGGCGFRFEGVMPSRPVLTNNGQLVELRGEIFWPRRVSRGTDGPSRWERMYWRSRTGKGKRTFAQAEALFAMENDWDWPDRSWPFMPQRDIDFYRLVEKVPAEALIPKPQEALA